MKSLVVPAVLAAVVASSSLALADQSTGTIKTFDAKAMTLTLQGGTRYYLPSTFHNPGLKAGEKVQVSWAMQGTKRMASDVTVQP